MGLLMAAAVFVSLPVVLIYLIIKQQFVQGIANRDQTIKGRSLTKKKVSPHLSVNFLFIQEEGENLMTSKILLISMLAMIVLAAC